MRRSLLYFFGLLFFVSNLWAQTSIDWQQYFGGDRRDIVNSIYESGGQIYAVGQSGSSIGIFSANKGSNDVWLITLDQSGNFTGLKNYGGSGNDVPRFMIPDGNGGFIVTGSSSSFDWEDENVEVTNTENAGAFIMRLNSVKELVWGKVYGGDGPDNPRCIRRTMDGGFIVLGETRSTDWMVNGSELPNRGEEDVFLLKLSRSGVIEWAKTYGGSGSDFARSVIETPDGDYVVVGYSNSDDFEVGNLTLGNKGEDDIIVMKLRNNGNPIWAKNMGGSDGEIATYVTQATDGGYVIGAASESMDLDGETLLGAGERDMLIYKLSPTGELGWIANFGGEANDFVRSVEKANGGFIVNGSTESPELIVDATVLENKGADDVVLIKLSSEGEAFWASNFGGTQVENIRMVQPTTDGGYILGGFSESSSGSGSDLQGINTSASEDFWMLKVSEEALIECSLALEDDMVLLEGGRPALAIFPFLNDELGGVIPTDRSVTILTQPEAGAVDYGDRRQIFRYYPAPTTLESVSFTYQVCSDDCLGACEEATVTIMLPDVILSFSRGVILDDPTNGLLMEGLDNYPQNNLQIFNRDGQLVYQETNYTNASPWVGRDINGAILPEGPYFLQMSFTGKNTVIQKPLSLFHE